MAVVIATLAAFATAFAAALAAFAAFAAAFAAFAAAFATTSITSSAAVGVRRWQAVKAQPVRARAEASGHPVLRPQRAVTIIAWEGALDA
jgi:hypothetical protein